MHQLNESAAVTVPGVTMNDVTANESFYGRPFDEEGIALSAIIIFTLLIVGLVGNTLTIAVITYYKELQENVFMRFILSLCVSDLISAMISWLFLYRRTWGFDVWSPLPDVFCKFYWAADIMTSYVTALHVLSFAILRFSSIRFPIFYSRITLKYGNIWIAMIWLICFIAGFIPCAIIFGSRTRDLAYRRQVQKSPYARWPACTALVEKLDAYRLYQKIGYSIFLYGPTIGVVVMCTATVALVAMRSRKTNSSGNSPRLKRKEKQGVLQLLLIIVSFLLGYIPFTAYEFWSVQDDLQTESYIKIDYWFGMAEYFLLRFSECLNPLFYNLGSTKVRRYTKKFLTGNVFVHCFKNVQAESSHYRGSEAIPTVRLSNFDA